MITVINMKNDKLGRGKFFRLDECNLLDDSYFIDWEYYNINDFKTVPANEDSITLKYIGKCMNIPIFDCIEYYSRSKLESKKSQYYMFWYKNESHVISSIAYMSIDKLKNVISDFIIGIESSSVNYSTLRLSIKKYIINIEDMMKGEE